MAEQADDAPKTDTDDVVIDHVVDNLIDPEVVKERRRRREQSPTTGAGEPVEDQVQKEWGPNKQGGLPTP